MPTKQAAHFGEVRVVVNVTPAYSILFFASIFLCSLNVYYGHCTFMYLVEVLDDVFTISIYCVTLYDNDK